MSEEEYVLVDPPEMNKNFIESLVGTKINDIYLYRRAFTHRSAVRKYKLSETNETLEFLGDSVLSFVVTKMLFDKYENMQEGFLTKARVKLVRGNTLAHFARMLKLQNCVIMDDKATSRGWNNNDKIMEDVFESLIGAIYMDLGLLHAKQFILGVYNNPEFIDLSCIMVDDNYKDHLMRYCQAQKLSYPQYNVNYHMNNNFGISVFVNNTYYGYGEGRTKKYAEQNAAFEALININKNMNPN